MHEYEEAHTGIEVETILPGQVWEIHVGNMKRIG